MAQYVTEGRKRIPKQYYFTYNVIDVSVDIYVTVQRQETHFFTDQASIDELGLATGYEWDTTNKQCFGAYIYWDDVFVGGIILDVKNTSSIPSTG